MTEVAESGRAEDEAINSVQPPFEIIVRNSGAPTPFLAQRQEGIWKLLEEAKAEYDLDASLRTDSKSQCAEGGRQPPRGNWTVKHHP